MSDKHHVYYDVEGAPVKWENERHGCPKVYHGNGKWACYTNFLKLMNSDMITSQEFEKLMKFVDKNRST